MNTDKNACSREPFTLDWTDFFTKLGINPAVNPITDSTWVVNGITLGPDFLSGVLATVILEAGVAGAPATAKNTIEIASLNYRDCRTLFIEIH